MRRARSRRMKNAGAASSRTISIHNSRMTFDESPVALLNGVATRDRSSVPNPNATIADAASLGHRASTAPMKQHTVIHSQGTVSHVHSGITHVPRLGG